ncbi:MAG: 2-C-methyl-D-erythritol 2,4-cyclodiphosphate synthase [Planctomycetes bacterium]|nr:2-C-methyl-D-erythritol 2,4-cyclodiphosphate synthase [Planctomycetota bacterium]
MIDTESFRIGQGYDSHALVAGRPFFLGGVELPAEAGAMAHSDGDCLLHALIDAILGASARGDIGQWFPDSDPAFKGVASSELLATVLADPEVGRFRIVNLDATVFLDRPRLSPHRETLQASLCRLLGLEPGRVNLKAKTWEGMPWAAALVAASATVLLAPA